jgi:hypothetical protein
VGSTPSPGRLIRPPVPTEEKARWPQRPGWRGTEKIKSLAPPPGFDWAIPVPVPSHSALNTAWNNAKDPDRLSSQSVWSTLRERGDPVPTGVARPGAGVQIKISQLHRHPAAFRLQHYHTNRTSPYLYATIDSFPQTSNGYSHAKAVQVLNLRTLHDRRHQLDEIFVTNIFLWSKSCPSTKYIIGLRVRTRNLRDFLDIIFISHFYSMFHNQLNAHILTLLHIVTKYPYTCFSLFTDRHQPAINYAY